MDEALDQMRGGRARWLVVSGEPGIGKTRLLGQLADRAAERRHPVFVGRGAELERELPFAIWIDALDDHVAALGERKLEALVGERVGELSRVLPSAGSGAAAGGGLQDERFHAYRAVRALLGRDGDGPSGPARPRRRPLGRRRLARADRPPAAAAAAGRRADRARLPRRPGCRTACWPRSRPPAATGSSTEIGLGPLTEAEADALLGAPALPVLYRQSGGNPFYLQELARAPAPADPSPARSERVGVPPAVAAALGQEIVGLPEGARRLGWGAAVAGEPFDLDLAAAAAGHGRARGAGGDRPAAGRQHRRRDRRGAALPLPPSARAPRRLRRGRRGVAARGPRACRGGARRAARRPVGARPPRRALGARGRRGGCRGARAGRPPGRRARPGDRARAGSRPRCGCWARRSAPAPRAGDVDPGRRLGLLVPLAGAFAATGRLERALDTLVESLALVDLPDLRVRLIAACAACENLLGRHDAAHARLLHALDALADQDAAAAAALHAELAADALYDSDFEAMRQWATQAGDTARALSDRGLEALAAALLCFAEYNLGARRRRGRRSRARLGADRRAARRAADDAARRAVLLRLRRLLLRALRRGDPAPAARDQPLARDRAGPVRDPDDGRPRARARDAWPARRGGRDGRRRRRGGAACRATGRSSASRWWRTRGRPRAGRQRARPRRRRRGRRAARRARRQRPHARHARTPRRHVVRPRRGRPLPGRLPRRRHARVPVDRARPARVAVRRAGACGAGARRPHGGRGVGRPQRGDRRGARPAARRGVGCSHARAAIALEAGDAQGRRRARARRRGARRLASTHRCPPPAAARWPASPSPPPAAATRACRSSPAPRPSCPRSAPPATATRQRASYAASASASRPASGAAAGEGLDALSGREREIAELVAEGRTNREIGEQVFLSEKTIEGHLTRIFAKLGVTSRAEVAEVVGRARAALSSFPP